jgi:uncharacterized membrane-anchored protein YitT (DUF2179 family)
LIHLFQYIITQAAKRKLANRKVPAKKSRERIFKETKVELSHYAKDAAFICFGIISASIGLNGFLLPNKFIDGGVTGISLIVTEFSGISLSILLVAINLPFIILGYSTIGKNFAFRSFIGILLLAILVHFIQIPTITDDKLLIAVFGGFFLGAGIGLAIRGGAVIDGTEVLAIYVSRKTHLTIGDVILVFNIIIFSVGAYAFSVEIALYAMLTYLAASKTVDFVVSGIEEYMGITIVSDYSDEIRVAIIEKMGRGCTIYNGKRGFGKRGDKLIETDILYTVITRLELAKLHTEIDKIDSKAFIVMHSIKDAKGGMIKKRPLE